MVSWKLLATGSEKELWELNLVKFSDRNIFQTFAWGEYKSCFGWKVYRWLAFNEEREIVAMMQGFARQYPFGCGLVWIPGGPVGSITCWNNQMRQAILESTGIKRLYCRFYSNRRYLPYDALMLKKNGWDKPVSAINSGLSMEYSLRKKEEQLLSGFSRNWRHNLRRSHRDNLTIYLWKDPEADRVYSLYSAMEKSKDIKQQFSKQELEKLFVFFGNSIILYRCDDKNGELLALRGCVILGDISYELFAATSEAGRKMYASYALFWELIKYCRARGVSDYDMAGIDPFLSKGVYDFKSGTGAIPIKYLGEWEWSNSAWFRLLVNLAVWNRHRL